MKRIVELFHKGFKEVMEGIRKRLNINSPSKLTQHKVLCDDCNNCRRLILTEEEQKVRGTRFNHNCGKYGVRVLHLGRHPKLTPCDRCNREGGYEPWL